jgi:putative ubiquitin-RnfH superfamily antitoxin RatB of RatAB toxin-antitoxin module
VTGDAAQTIRVEVAYARPDLQRIVPLDVPSGTTLMEAVRRSDIVSLFPEIDLDAATFGIFGKVVRDHETVLRPGDRVEIYRPLIADPKARRAERARAQRAEKGS